MEYPIENEHLLVTIKSKGAELASIVNNQTQLEYMWGAGPAWAKSSPVLFPIVGTLKDNTYTYKNKTYQLPRHGFARDEAFEVEQSQKDSITFLLTSSAPSLEKYPFHFELRISYQLKQDEVFVTYQVTNLGNEEMYFSLGAHPAFKVPLTNALQFEDYYLQFSRKEKASRWLITKEGLIDLKSTPLLIDIDRLDLTHQLFYEDAIVLKKLNSELITLKTDKDEHGLEFHFTGFPFLGLWAAKDANFICIEPWCGIADSVNHNHDFTSKEGIEKIAAGTSWWRSWSVRCY
jgi:galactose mutarotase-like enzyme